MLMASCRTPQSVAFHPGRDGIGALRNSQSERISRQTVAFDKRDQVCGVEHE